MANKRRTAIVSGSTGYIGSELVKRLVDLNWEVLCLVRPQSERSTLSSVETSIKFCTYDGTLASLNDAFSQKKIDIVFHLASCFVAEHKSEQIDDLLESNIRFGTQILEAMKVADVQSLINTGTAWQHYQNEEYNPVCFYAATKQAFADILRFYTESGIINAITLEIFDTYGPNDPRRKLIPALVDAASSGKELQMSEGEQTLDFTYIDDVLQAYIESAELLLTKRISKNEIYAITSDERYSLLELVGIFEEIWGVKLSLVWGSRPYRKREVFKPWSKGKRIPGWSAETNLHQGLARIKDQSE